MSYVEFNPPRGIETYPNRIAMEIIEEVAKDRAAHRPPKYLVKGEWTYSDGRQELDIAINRAWVEAVSNYKIVEGRLRWVCPVCQKMSGTHAKSCDYE
jgi:hypothetical protein